jgi:hypothetical protein
VSSCLKKKKKKKDLIQVNSYGEETVRDMERHQVVNEAWDLESFQLFGLSVYPDFL